MIKEIKIKLLMTAMLISLVGWYQSVNADSNQRKQSKHSKQANTYPFTETETINEVMQFSDQTSTDNRLTVFNVYGSVDVQAHAGNDIVIEANNQVFGKTEEVLQEGLDEIGLKFEQEDQGVGQKITVYLDSPYTYIDRDSGKIWHSDTCWRHNDCSRKHPRKAYRYHMDIMVKVPMNTSLEVSTINQGDITVVGIDAKTISVNNINGAIDMNDVAGQINAYALNKDVNIAYRTNPTTDSSYESLNGDLNITFASQPNVEVVYQTNNGEFYSAFDVSVMAPKVKRIVEHKEHGIQYKLDANSRLKVGAGGSELRFQTLNGDIKIQRQ